MHFRKYVAAAILLLASLGAGNAHALAISSAGVNGNWNAIATWTGVAGPGTMTVALGATNVTGVGTSFTQLKAGDQLCTAAACGTPIGLVQSVTNNTQLTLQVGATAARANQAYGIRKVPDTNDSVTIVNAAHTIQVTATAATTTVTFTTGGSNTTLQINANQQLTVTGLTINGNTSGITKRVDLIAGTTTLTVSGNVALARSTAGAICEIRLGNNANTLVDIAGGLTMNNAGENLTFSGAGTTKIGGAMTTGGTLTVGTGTVDFDGGAAQTIPVYTYNNVTISNTAAAVTTGGSFAVNGNLTVNANALLQPTAATIISGTGTLTGDGTARVTRTAATPGFLNQYTITNKTLTNLTVEYFNAAGNAQTMSGTTYGDVIINHTAGGTTTVAGTATVNGTLTLTAGTLAVAGNTLALNGPTIAGTPTNLTTTNASTLSFGGSSSGVNVPSTVTQVLNLTVNNANGITLNSSPTINGTLTFTQGNIDAGANSVIIPAAGTVSRTSGHVIGNLQRNFTGAALTRTFEIGDANAYAPLSVTFASVSVAGNLIAKTVSGEHPDIANANIESAEDVNRYWVVTNSGITFTTYDATFNYAQGGYSADVDGSVTPSTFIVGRATPSSCGAGACTWTYPTISGSPTGTQAVITGVNSFSDFAIGHRKIANFLVEAAGGGNIPSQTQNVSFNIRITARDAFGNTVASFTGTVDITSTCTLSSGSGTTAAFTGGVLATHSVTISSIGTCSITATRTSGGSQAGTSNTFTVATEAVSFNGCENTNPRCTVGAANYDRLFTKLASTGFNLDLVALKSGGTLASGFASTVTVDLLANSAPQGVGANNCPAGQTAVISLGSSTFSGGRPTAAISVAGGAFSGVAPNYSAYRDVRVRVTCDAANCPPSGLTYCSADNFTVRPTDYSVASSMTNGAQSGAPAAAAGSDFTLTATAVAGYAGTPTLDRTLAGQKVVTHSGATDYTSRLRDAAGGSTITFPAATIGTGAASATVQYHDAGNVGILAGGIVDSTYTVDDPSKGECIAASSSNSDNDANANNGLVYGCNVANLSNSSLFGRFFPGYYTLSSGTVTAACVAGGYSYMGHAAMGLAYTLSAMSQDNPGGATLKLSKYTSGYASLATVNVLSEDGTNSTDLTGSITPSLAYSASNWSAGDYAVSGSAYSFARPASTPSGPYDSFYIGAGVTDSDGATLTGVDFKLGDPSCTVSCTHKKLAGTPSKIRFGRMRLQGAMGADNLNLPLALRTEYWTGSGFATNTLDSCTALTPSPAKKFVLYGHQGGITTGNMVTPDGTTDGNVSTSGTFAAGVSSLTLLKPSPAATSPGSVRICLDLDSGAGGDTSCQAFAPANLPHLQGIWSGSSYDKDPNARASFGLFGAQPRQFIFFRETY